MSAARPAADDPLTARIAALVACFAAIGETQMKDLPIYNHKLAVEAVGFRPFCALYVGVLITPWFINAIALPRHHAPARDDDAAQQTVRLPAGPQVFLRGFDAAIGTYWSKSLLSALFHLHGQDDARGEAAAGLAAMMTPAADGGERPAGAVSRRDLFRGRVR